jgi:acid phosphatase
MLLFFAIPALPLRPACEAPRVFASPVPNNTLVYLQVLFRHGMRTPTVVFLNRSDRGAWTCNALGLVAAHTVSAPARRYRLYHRHFDPRYVEFPPSCRAGDLTAEGMTQHLDLGRAYRQNYFSFLPELLHPDHFTFVTSPVDRCIRSAEAFLLGLYPSESPNEVLYLQTGTETTSDLMVQGTACPEIDAANQAFQNGAIVQQFMNDTWPIMKPAFDILGLSKNYSSYAQFASWAVAFNCSETAEGPPWLTDEVMNVSQRMSALTQYGTFANATRGLYASYLLRHILRDADTQLGSATGKKMAIFSAHDTSLAAALVALGFTEDHIPFYASHLAFEYWRSDDGLIKIRVVFNGKPVLIDPFMEEVVPFDDFRTVVQPFLAHCPDVESWEAYQ